MCCSGSYTVAPSSAVSLFVLRCIRRKTTSVSTANTTAKLAVCIAFAADSQQLVAGHDFAECADRVCHRQPSTDMLQPCWYKLRRIRAGTAGQLQDKQHDGDESARLIEQRHKELNDHHERDTRQHRHPMNAPKMIGVHANAVKQDRVAISACTTPTPAKSSALLTNQLQPERGFVPVSRIGTTIVESSAPTNRPSDKEVRREARTVVRHVGELLLLDMDGVREHVVEGVGSGDAPGFGWRRRRACPTARPSRRRAAPRRSQARRSRWPACRCHRQAAPRRGPRRPRRPPASRRRPPRSWRRRPARRRSRPRLRAARAARPALAAGRAAPAAAARRRRQASRCRRRARPRPRIPRGPRHQPLQRAVLRGIGLRGGVRVQRRRQLRGCAGKLALPCFAEASPAASFAPASAACLAPPPSCPPAASSLPSPAANCAEPSRTAAVPAFNWPAPLASA